MADKTTLLRAFNTHFFDFIDDILNIFPENEDLKVTKIALQTIKKTNPTSILKAWQYFVFSPYRNVIEDGNITFFFDKDYSADLNYMPNAKEIMGVIDQLREPVRSMSDVNKSHSMKYIQNLSKLSNNYTELSK
jgi:hypothetical protein